MLLNNELIASKIQADFEYDETQAQDYADRLMNLDELLKDSFVNWFENNETPDIDIDGYTVDELVGHYGMNIIDAILMMDLLVKNPAEAKKLLDHTHNPNTDPNL
jgi:hypothetical protein